MYLFDVFHEVISSYMALQMCCGLQIYIWDSLQGKGIFGISFLVIVNLSVNKKFLMCNISDKG